MARKPSMKKGTFSRKHFLQIAKILKNNGPLPGVMTEWNAGARSVHKSITLALAELFAADNDNFDRVKFLAEAGLGGN